MCIKNTVLSGNPQNILGLILIAVLAVAMPGIAEAQELVRQYPVGDAPTDLAVGQLNTKDDNYPDIAIANRKEESISILLSDGKGGYLERVDYPLEGYATGLKLADIDNDGHMDILVTDLSDLENNNGAGIFFGDGIGSFSLKNDYPGYSDAQTDLEVGDFNNDGSIDFISLAGSGDGEPSYVTVSLNNGDSFQPQSSYAVGAGAYDVDVADINKDDKLDVVTANNEAASLSVLSGDGTGGFVARKDYSVEEEPRSVAIGDVNNDGNLDLVSASYGFHAVSVLLGDGQGDFSTSKEYQVGDGPESVVIADINSDGNADVVTANYISFASNPAVSPPNSVTVLPGDGSGKFGTRLDFPVGDGPFFAIVEDMNLDDKAEIVSADRRGDTITLLTPLMPAASSESLELEESQVAHGVLQAGDLQGDSLTFEISAPPQHGEVTITNADAGDYEYAPATGYAGTDNFTYIASDGEYNSAPGTISITVKPSGQGGNNDNEDNDGNTDASGGGGTGWILVSLLVGAGVWRKILESGN